MNQPFAYQQRVVAWMKQHSQLWQSFHNPVVTGDDGFQNILLKHTYRLEPGTEPQVYAAVDKAKQVLGISLPVTVYQLLDSVEPSASIYMTFRDAHIVCSGPLLKLMNEQEILAVLSHELGHVLLYQTEDHDYQTTHRILDACMADASACQQYMETARRFSLYTELYCDRAAMQVLQDPLPVVASLVKVTTGLEQVSAENYIRQAEELFRSGDIFSEQLSHPELYIRAYALHLASNDAAAFEAMIVPAIEGRYELEKLDLFARHQIEQDTRQLIAAFLSDAKLQTETLLNLARQYFPDFKPGAPVEALQPSWLQRGDQQVKQYAAGVLLDFAQADADIEQEAYQKAFAMAGGMGLKDVLKDLLKKEFKLSEKKFTDRFKKTLAPYA